MGSKSKICDYAVKEWSLTWTKYLITSTPSFILASSGDLRTKISEEIADSSKKLKEILGIICDSARHSNRY